MHQPNHYISPVKDAYGRQPCLDCDCDPQGSTNLQCSVDGKCQCKPGVTGDKCDMCEANYWNFPDEASLKIINTVYENNISYLGEPWV